MLKYLIGVFLFICATGLSAAKTPPPAEMEARGDGVIIRISADLCTNKKVLALLEPQFHKDFRKAEVKVKDKKAVGACWVVDVNGVFVMAEDGNMGYVPLEVFKPVQTI